MQKYATNQKNLKLYKIMETQLKTLETFSLRLNENISTLKSKKKTDNKRWIAEGKCLPRKPGSSVSATTPEEPMNMDIKPIITDRTRVVKIYIYI